MKKAYLFFIIFGFYSGWSQTCQSIDPAATAGSTSCVAFNYGGAAVEYITVRSADGNIWLQQNLGSANIATSATDETAYGDLFQWGRWQDGHEKRTSVISAIAPSPNNPHGLGTGSETFYTSNPSWWSAGLFGDQWEAASVAEVTDTNGCDPCKAMGNGWRLPTEAEWETVIASEGITNVATAFGSNLKLTVAGSRNSSGNLASVNARGYYWSSTPSSGNANYGKYLFYSNITMNPNAGAPRNQGSSVRCIKGLVTTVPVPESLTIVVMNNVPAQINTNDGTLQLLAAIFPSGVSQSATWSIVSGAELATISVSGLVSAIANGTITVKAASVDAPTVFNIIDIVITNQIITPASLEITVQDSAAAQINASNGTLQLNAAILPADASQSVTWSIISGDGFATITENGLVSAAANGTITVQAISVVDAALLDTIEIIITGQIVAPESLEIGVKDDAVAQIIIDGGTLQLTAVVIPAEAGQDVIWSIVSGSELASINATGEVTAIANGTVIVQAVSTVDTTILDTIIITISNQNLASSAPYCLAAVEWDVEPITLVQFAGINNATSAQVNGTPSYESFINITGNVTQNETYTLTVKGNTVGLFAHDIRVFIDWNQNEVFDMATEYYATSLENTTGEDGVQAALNISIPLTAATGTTRMRITKDQWNVYEEGDFDACTYAYYGQVEDYSLNVSEPAMGVHEVNKTSFTVYPNPAIDTITVQSSSEIKSIEVYNLTGQRIAAAEASELNLGSIAEGVYMLKVHFMNGGTAAQKIIKN